jgi:pimeloyl-ACP methyl ester carboxylesterase
MDMKKTFPKSLIIFALALLITLPSTAQDAAKTPEATPQVYPVPVAPQTIRIKAQDGLMLVGDFYTLPSAGGAPTVVLLHQLWATRLSWRQTPLVGNLLGAGYNVLAVDVRGFGETGGSIAWRKAVIDVQTWLDWLRTQPGVRANAVSLIGSSMGSNLAMVGCANDSLCRTAIAISPGLNYYGIITRWTVQRGLLNRSVLLVTSRRDVYSGPSVQQLVKSAATDIEVQAQVYEGNNHGMELFAAEGDTLLPLIVEWLNKHTPGQL